MLVAITYDLSNNTVWQHFGQTQYFMLFNTENGDRNLISSGGYSHKDLVPYLSSIGVKTLICGGLGNMAMTLLQGAGIEVIPGVTGDINDVISSYQEGKLKGDNSVLHDCDCGHHH